MTVDEWVLRQAAKDLVHLFAELDAAKFAPTRRPEVRTMRPAPGPRPPAPDHLVSLDEELSSRLMEYVRDLANHVRPHMILHKDGGRLAAFVVWHAQEAADMPFAVELMEEITDQIKTLRHRLQPRGVDEVANRPEPRHVSAVILQRLHQRGVRATREQLRQWASRSARTDGPVITSVIRADGKATYLMTEVLRWLEVNKPSPDQRE